MFEVQLRRDLKSAANDGTARSTKSALRALRQFMRGPGKGREMFIKPKVHGEVDAAAHNEWSLMLWAEYMLVTPSKKTRRPVSVSTITTYISLVKTELSIRWGFELVASTERRMKRVLKQMRSRQPVANRRKRRGLRGHHLRRAFAKMGYKGNNSKRAVNEWAALATAREAVARGSELCYGAFSSKKPGPTRADVTFEDDRYGKTATLWLRPLKKRGQSAAAKIPIVFAAYNKGGSDTHAALVRLFEHDPVPHAKRATTPLFRDERQRGMSCRRFRELVKTVAVKLGFDPRTFGAHSPRIGGATDIGDKSPLLLQAKGRWAGDIGRIYARLTRRGLVKASKAMQLSRARDMEEIHAHFSQPA